MKKNSIKFLLLFIITITGCSADLKTKDMVNTDLKNQSVSVVENALNLTYVENHAIAFGLFENLDRSWRIPLIFSLPFLMTLFCVFFLWKIRHNEFRMLLPIFILLGGAYGNIIDRAMNGYVTDFLHVHYQFEYNFYVFNVADVLINIGVILILLQYKDFSRLWDTTFHKSATPDAQ